MKLCTIISAWGDTLELLPHCIENHLGFADGVIVVWSETSNHGVKDHRMKDFVFTHKFPNVIFYQLEPLLSQAPVLNERRKRNTGIDVARKHLFTHFIIADADEFYDCKQVEWEKNRFSKPIYGLVCGLKVYVKYPTLRTDDHTLIPFIHKLTQKIKCAENRYYPFAIDNSGAHIDPTRRFNIQDGVQWSEITMHHMSYVRKDINLKINNSTAKLVNSRDIIHQELREAKAGYKSKLYHKELEECSNQFNLPLWE